MFNLAIPHGKFSAHYSIQNIYLGIMYNEMSAVEISEHQFKTCQKANGKFCNLSTLLLPLANPPICVSALHAKDKAIIQKRCSLHIRKASSISIPTYIAPNIWIITSPNHSSATRNHTHLPWRSTQICHTTDAHPHTLIATSMQCQITAFSSTTML